MHSSCSMQLHQHRCNSTMLSSCSLHGSSASQSSSFKLHHVHGLKSYRPVVVRAGSNGAENGRLTSEKQREIAKMLLQTQKNMLELNNSRVKVQEELAVAHRRIADLERELERLKVEQAREQLTKAEQAAAAPPAAAPAAAAAAAAPAAVQAPPAPQTQAPPAPAPAAAAAPPPPPPAAAPAPAATRPATPPATPQPQPPQQQWPPPAPQQPPPPPPQQQQQQAQQQVAQAVAPPPATNHHSPPPQQQQQQVVVQPAAAAAVEPPKQQPPPPPPAPPAVINLTYISGWHNCFIHYQVEGKSWTQVPGERLTTSKQDHMVKTITIQGNKMEFVMTNGENDWDSPGRYTEKPKNYAITAPGNYKLKSGKLELLP